jgi:hypothetical protein
MSVIGTVVSKDLVKVPAGLGLQIGTQVRIEPIVAAPKAMPTEPPPNNRPIREVLKDLTGVADDLPSDLARNHDHYLYGAPRK